MKKQKRTFKSYNFNSSEEARMAGVGWQFPEHPFRETPDSIFTSRPGKGCKVYDLREYEINLTLHQHPPSGDRYRNIRTREGGSFCYSLAISLTPRKDEAKYEIVKPVRGHYDPALDIPHKENMK